MNVKTFVSHTLRGLRTAATSVAVLQMSVGPVLAAGTSPLFGGLWDASRDRSGETVTPIKHVIVIIGENRSFDHVFATYVPQRGQTVRNLLSEGIIQLDGAKNAIPGPNFTKAEQLAASDQGPQDAFLLSPPKQTFPNNVLPLPEAGGPSGANGYFTPSSSKYTTIACGTTTVNGNSTTNYLTPAACAAVTETGLPANATDANGLTYYQSLASGGTGQYAYTPDLRISDFYSLPAGPFQLTNGTRSATPGYSLGYTDYSASPVHRFYQMWQQLNCSVESASLDNPSGCNGNLFSWVETTVGAGTNGLTQQQYAQSYYGSSVSTNFEYPTGYGPTNPPTESQWTANKYALYDSVPTTTGEGSSALGFYNMQQGDVPYFKSLADTYAMSDNFHQSVNGGTGVNHIMLGHGDMIWFSDGNGHAEAPPHNVPVTTDPAGYSGTGTIDEIENPNPASGTNNWYTQDGYGVDYNAGYPKSDWATTQPNGLPIIYGGGSYSECSDPTQPGVKPILQYLRSLRIDPRCEAGHYYLLNNYNPGWFGNGHDASTDHSPSNTPFTVPPSSTRSIGDDMNDANVSWKYYGDQWNNYINDPYQLNWGANGPNSDEYCNICNPFQYDSSIMSNPAQVAAHIQDTVNLYADITNGTLPAVSFVKPSGYVDGHPASSKLDLFEGFVKKIVDQVEASPTYTKDTVILITEDEGGGYYDSGYVQPLDFFGDGTRIPLIVVANPQYLPLHAGGYISHQYADHVSILKFIERNWSLSAVTQRSRDNFPNPIQRPGSYAPANSPALDDLFDFFDFPSSHGFF
ncbi:MAG TPA: alkaline phosphatase family protein [Steroidobacteraceae bacterium]|jgi:phospholipase C|nr:alkaline phosphatase family protein [Steroidobacteraceae bacterium]